MFTITENTSLQPSPQMPASKGIKLYGEAAVAAMMKEFKQLVFGSFPNKPVVEAIGSNTLTNEEKKTALDAINLIKVKKNGIVKGRTCANGIKERLYLPKEYSVASPTASLEAIISTLLVDVYEDRNVGIFDIPGAYLHAEIPEEHRVILKLKVTFVDIMCGVNPEFRKHVTIEKGQKVLYMKVMRAIYGCIRSAMLWYNLFSETLQQEGYKINPYDRWVAESSQCTIFWYVDDNKISHKNESVVTSKIEKISQHFGDLSIQRGNDLQFLGMDIKLDRKNKSIHISMLEHVKDAINMMDEELRSGINSPNYRDLFTTYDESSKPLNEEKSTLFHRIVAKLLYITKRARPDLETSIS